MNVYVKCPRLAWQPPTPPQTQGPLRDDTEGGPGPHLTCRHGCSGAPGRLGIMCVCLCVRACVRAFVCVCTHMYIQMYSHKYLCIHLTRCTDAECEAALV